MGKFERNSVISITMALLTGAITYVYQILMGRIISVEQYGYVNSVLSIIMMGIAMFMPFCIWICKLQSTRDNITKEEYANQFGEFKTAVLSLILLVIIVGGLLAFFLGRDNKLKNYYIVLVLVCENGVFTLLQHYIQGEKRFFQHGMTGIILNLVKVVGFLIVVKSFFSTTRYVLSLFCAYLIAIIFEAVYIRTTWIKGNYRKLGSGIYRQYFDSLIPTIIEIVLRNGLDLLLIRYLYSERDSGLYSVSICLLKMGMYVVAPICTVFFPEIASTRDISEKRKILKKVAWLSILPMLGFSIILFILGDRIVLLVYGEKYIDSVRFIPFTALFVIGLILYDIMFYYNMASDVSIRYQLSAIVCVVLVALSAFASHSIESFLALAGSVIILTVIFQFNSMGFDNNFGSN